jgi:hypothetical protein
MKRLGVLKTYVKKNKVGELTQSKFKTYCNIMLQNSYIYIYIYIYTYTHTQINEINLKHRHTLFL